MRFPNLRPSTQAISIRLPVSLLEQIKIQANKRDVPYQSLIKIWLADKEMRLTTAHRLLEVKDGLGGGAGKRTA